MMIIVRQNITIARCEHVVSMRYFVTKQSLLLSYFLKSNDIAILRRYQQRIVEPIGSGCSEWGSRSSLAHRKNLSIVFVS